MTASFDWSAGYPSRRLHEQARAAADKDLETPT